jgi:hypothetical protein
MTKEDMTVKKSYILLGIGLIFSAGMFAGQAMAAEFHVTNATEFQNALNTAQGNGEDDIVYLGAGTYLGNFTYKPPESEHKSLSITGDWGTRAEDIILDGQNSGRVLNLYDWSEGSVAEIRMNGVSVQNGDSAYGAGVYAALAKYNIFITNCIIRNNRADGIGGGMLMNNSLLLSQGTLTLENSLILDNTVTETLGSGRGGGVGMVSDHGGNYIIRNNIIARNAAQGASDPRGGGLWIGETNSNNIHLIGNSIYGNQANKGAGVYLEHASIANIYNNTIYGNTGTEGRDLYFASVANLVGYNNNYSNMYGTWTDSGGNVNTDPLFVDPTNDDFHLQATSPMIDAGTSSVPDPPGLPATDFAGNLRSFGAAPDIGACEWSSVHPNRGTTGTEMSVTGSGYGTNKGKVLLGTLSLKVLEWTDTLIRALLSRSMSPGPCDLTIQPKKASAIVIENGFEVTAPEIRSLDPTTGSAGDEITIYGFFIGTKKGKLTLGGKSCKIRSWTMDKTTGESEIRFVVPKRLAPGTNELKVINKVGKDTESFTVN